MIRIFGFFGAVVFGVGLFSACLIPTVWLAILIKQLLS